MNLGRKMWFYTWLTLFLFIFFFDLEEGKDKSSLYKWIGSLILAFCIHSATIDITQFIPIEVRICLGTKFNTFVVMFIFVTFSKLIVTLVNSMFFHGVAFTNCKEMTLKAPSFAPLISRYILRLGQTAHRNSSAHVALIPRCILRLGGQMKGS